MGKPGWRPPTMQRYRAAAAWVGGEVRRDVEIDCVAGLISSIRVDCRPDPWGELLPGLVVPGFADAHSHIFHRGLRGRTHDGGGTFWTWRDRMYELAGRLGTPRSASSITCTTRPVAAGTPTRTRWAWPSPRPPSGPVSA